MDHAPGGEDRLAKLARQGDEAAFLSIYHDHRLAVFRFVWRLTGSVSVAEDVTQECFLTLLSQTGFDERRGALRTYLLGTARHLAMRRIRDAEREEVEIEDAASDADVLSAMLAAERAELVQRAVMALPVRQREALVLFEYEELSLEQIATITEAQLAAVKSRLHRARESLRRRLAPVLAHERSCS